MSGGRPPTVVLTASADGLGGAMLAARLSAAGAVVRSVPLLDFGPPETWAPLDDALARLGEYAAVAVTSPRAAAALSERLRVAGVPRTAVPPVWTTGLATRAPLAALEPRLVEPTAVVRLGAAAALAEAMLSDDVGTPVLFACGDQRLDALPRRLREAGRRVDEVVCYRTVLADPSHARLALTDADVLVVASPSVARLLVATRAELDPAASGTRPWLVAAGPSTAAALAGAGWPADRVADAVTPEGLCAAVLAAPAAAVLDPGTR